MFENLRKWEAERENDSDFTKTLSSFAEIYVNDCFAVSHRKHSSVVGVPKHLPSYFGFQILEEVESLSRAFEPEHPFVFILGGAKVETKLPLLLKFVGEADTLFIGGVLANDFLKARGDDIGKSITSDIKAPAEILNGNNVFLPNDFVVLRGDGRLNVSLSEIQDDDYIYDAGEKSIAFLEKEISGAHMIIWNGPLGYYEDGFNKATDKVAKALAESRATTILGGGDVTAAISDELEAKMTFVSTGGGAMLEFLVSETLVGIEAVLNSK